MLFNNAGVGATRPWETITLDDWHQVMDINLWGVIHGLYYAVPIMRKQGGGHIINTSSVAGLLNIPYQAVYCAGKAAVTAIGEALRYEMVDENIAVTTIHPGNVKTAIFDAAGSVTEDAITVEQATHTILQAVSAQAPIVTLPESVRQWAENLRQDSAQYDRVMTALSRERRHNYLTKGNYF